MKTFFWQNHTQNVVEELFPELFLKKSKLRISEFVFIVRQIKGYQKILKLNWRPLAFTLYKTSVPATFSA